jgi:cytochrome c oxidase subunit 2
MARLLVIPLLMLVVGSSTSTSSRLQDPPVRVVDITAQRFEFWPSEVRLAENETVQLRIHSDDTMHGFRIVGSGVNLIVPKRGKGDAVATFTASAPGRYTIECSRMCGAGHNFMRATLVVRAASQDDAR